MTYKEAAQYIAVPLGTLYSLVCRKRIPHVRLGKRFVRFKREHLDKWIDTGVVRQSGEYAGLGHAPVGGHADATTTAPSR
ncbi:MAG: excisionase family DNA-binding protein [Deltaproteobacteria bacterium]|nr:excisionase family DNA-binding protein [Deltaproteobacteria bacterium]